MTKTLPEFPFSKSEWDQVQAAGHRLMNATLIGDDVLRATYLEALQVLLNTLRGRYGDHPVLKETEADFLDEPSIQIALYREAIESARKCSFPTYTMHLSLAGLLIDAFSDRREAALELAAAENETMSLGDTFEKSQWHDLKRQCGETQPG